MERRNTSLGFTLVEILLVILAMAALGIAMFVRWPSVTSFSLDGVGYQVAGDIYYAQGLAMSMNEHYRVTFTSTSYTIADGSSTAVQNPGTGTTSVTLPSNTTFSSLPTGSCIAFNGRGVPYDCTANTPLAANATITLSQNSKQVQITVTHTTGYISVG